jgi:hypothetical protein
MANEHDSDFSHNPSGRGFEPHPPHLEAVQSWSVGRLCRVRPVPDRRHRRDRGPGYRPRRARPGLHSKKEQTAPTFKHTYAYHPLLAFCDNTGEFLAAALRPGNAGSNTATDHTTVLDAALT